MGEGQFIQCCQVAQEDDCNVVIDVAPDIAPEAIDPPIMPDQAVPLYRGFGDEPAIAIT